MVHTANALIRCIVMHSVHLPGIDLNLLPLLEALLIEQHVTRAARRVGLSQPAASRGLARLRALIGDPLLIRTKQGFSLTPRAEQLREEVRPALARIAAALGPQEAFDPANVKRTVRLAGGDYAEFVLLPPLLERLAAQAPGIDVLVLPPRSPFAESLQDSEVDFVLVPGSPALATAGVRRTTLFEERFVVVMRRGHPLSRPGALTVERFASSAHAFIAPRGKLGGVVDEVLGTRGLERRIALALPHFLVAPFVIAKSPLVLTLAERVARAYAEVLPLVIREPPLPLPTFAMSLWWHERSDADPALRWFQQLLVQTAASLPLMSGAGNRHQRSRATSANTRRSARTR